LYQLTILNKQDKWRNIKMIVNKEEKEKRRIASIIKSLNKVLEKNYKKGLFLNDSTEINAYKYVLNILNKKER
tara:strand:- start:248 stop:466 length:219 start_codon:yes stop_codon:yes gene_type:complete